MKLLIFISIFALDLILRGVCQEVFSDMHAARLKYLMNLQRGGIIKLDRILDIGANIGDWTRLAHAVFPNSKIFMIEANPELESELKPFGGDNYEIALLGDKKRIVQFHTNSKSSTGGSVFKEFSYLMKFKDVSSNERKMVTVDYIIKKRNLDHFDFIKIDVQGAELLVLQGARKALERATIVMAEVSIHQYNPGSPSFGDINTFMTQQGFRIYDIMDLRHMFDARSDVHNVETLVQMDVLWARTESNLFYGVKYPRPPTERYHCEMKPHGNISSIS